MTIAKGRPWGEAAALPEDAVIVGSDASLAAAVGTRPVGLIGGDLCRTLGGTGSVERLRSPEAMTFPIDVLWVSLDGGAARPCVAHVVARGRGWRRAWAAMNAQWLGDWNLAPRAHPNDGLIDGLEWSLPWRQWRQVRRLLPTGAHLPHPALAVSRRSVMAAVFSHPCPVWLDGELVGPARRLDVALASDGLRVVV